VAAAVAAAATTVRWCGLDNERIGGDLASRRRRSLCSFTEPQSSHAV